MGFSVSGAAAIIFASGFVAFGMWYSAAGTSFEQVTDAQKAETNQVLEGRNTDISILSATYDQNKEYLNISVNNTGAAQLRLGNVDLLVDGEYIKNWRPDTTIAGFADTNLWFGAETLEINHSISLTNVDRVKIVSGPGIGDSAGVTSV